MKTYARTNNWITRIAWVKRIERRTMKDLREVVGTKAGIVGKIVKSQMTWAGHMVRIKDQRLPKRSETKEVAETKEDHR